MPRKDPYKAADPRKGKVYLTDQVREEFVDNRLKGMTYPACVRHISVAAKIMKVDSKAERDRRLMDLYNKLSNDDKTIEMYEQKKLVHQNLYKNIVITKEMVEERLWAIQATDGMDRLGAIKLLAEIMGLVGSRNKTEESETNKLFDRFAEKLQINFITEQKQLNEENIEDLGEAEVEDELPEELQEKQKENEKDL